MPSPIYLWNGRADPLVPVIDPAWIASTNAISYFTPKNTDPHSGYLQLVDAAIEGSDTFDKKREVIDEFGWRHFGDIYGDHEAVFHRDQHRWYPITTTNMTRSPVLPISSCAQAMFAGFA